MASSLDSLLLQNLGTHSIWVVALSFAAGVTSSLLPCAIAMLPIIVGYIGGYSKSSSLEMLIQVSLFIVGLSLVMTALGIISALAGITFGSLIGSWWYYVTGVLAILMALQLLNLIHIPLPQFVKRFPQGSCRTGNRRGFAPYGKRGYSQTWKIPAFTTLLPIPTAGLAAPIILGVAFGAASSPCGTPFLAAILGFISHEKNALLGGASLFFYALGESVIILVAGLFAGLLKHMATLHQIGAVANILSALLLILAGVLLIASGAGFLANALAFFSL